MFICYTNYFTGWISEEEFKCAVSELKKVDEDGKKALGENYYITYVVGGDFAQIRSKNSAPRKTIDRVGEFVEQLLASFDAEKAETERLKKTNAVDYIVCGGGFEGHKLQKEVNFSDTLVNEKGVCRVAGTLRGADFSRINTHGWFGYFVKVKPNAENQIKLRLGSIHSRTDMKISYGNEQITINDERDYLELTLPYTEKDGKDEVYIRFDRLTGYTPCVYSIEVQA